MTSPLKLTVRVKPNARQAAVTKSGNAWTVAVKEPPQENRANEAVRKAIATHLGIAPSNVRLLHGATTKTKTFAIEGITAESLTAKT